MMPHREGELPLDFPADAPIVPSPAEQRRALLEARWIELTNRDLPGAADARRWPIRLNHCFQRVLLDHACGDVWYRHIEGRPAYRHAPEPILVRALQVGEACLKGEMSLVELNQISLVMRGKVRAR
ncbi:MAG: GCN5-related N-acetyltransferase [Pseudomonadota bacterium]